MIRIVRFLLFVALAVLAAALFLGSRYGSQAVLKAERWLDRVQHRSYYHAGRTLPGTPDLDRLDQRLARKGLKAGAPVFIRIFKQDFELELWLQNGKGRLVHFATYPMCYWSGRPGPKLKEGDRQSPEGFYTVSSGQLNPNSRWHRSFNLGFPNTFDRAHGRTGSFLMVHGGCASIGCYAMTNAVIDEIWALVTAALKAGQPRFSVHAFPFRMTERRMWWHGRGPWGAFWRDLKRGHDLFEKTKVPPRIAVCEGRYIATPGEPGSAGTAPVREDCSVRVSRNQGR